VRPYGWAGSPAAGLTGLQRELRFGAPLIAIIASLGETAAGGVIAAVAGLSAAWLAAWFADKRERSRMAHERALQDERRDEETRQDRAVARGVARVMQDQLSAILNAFRLRAYSARRPQLVARQVISAQARWSIAR
jgi:hypothetical protein